LPDDEVRGAGPLLTRALADGDDTMQRADGRYVVWVYLTDRNLDPAGLASALAARERELPQRTLARRARAAEPGAPLVDARDLPVAATYRDRLAATGAEIRNQSRWLNALSVAATRAQLANIAALPFVDRLELVATFRRIEPGVSPEEEAAAARAMATARDRAAKRAEERQTVDYGPSLATLEQINVPPVHDLGITGEGVVIGVLDTGFKTTHEALVGVEVLARYDFINDDDVVENEPGDPSNQHDHGTKAMSAAMGFADGELVGPAFGAAAILAKTEDRSDEYPAEEDYWVAGLEWVESLGADVVTSSLGYYDWYEFADLDGNTAVTTIAADLAVARGIVVVNSAGNERGTGFGHIIAPADGDSVIAVGAVTIDGDVATFSSPGPTFDGRIKPDVAAQGVSNRVVFPDSDTQYTVASGTSFSCPLAAGVAALVLARVPDLSPVQVREALRMTADRADDPDNDTGWGILDAYGAVTYWGALIVHEPLGDTEDLAGPIVFTADITGRVPLDPERMHVRWRADGGGWQELPLVLQQGDTWIATLPAPPDGTRIDYYLEVTDTGDITTRWPVAGADAPFSFRVGIDQTPPVIAHELLGDQPLATWPPLVTCEVTDNIGVDRVELTFRHQQGAWQGPFALTAGADDRYTLPFPLPASALAEGDSLAYEITAHDASSQQLTASVGASFMVFDAVGVVLVIEDAGRGVPEAKQMADKRVVEVASGRSSATEIASWLTAAGYVADVMAADDVTPGSLEGYEAVVYSAGSNTTPLGAETLRAELIEHVVTGGRLMVEGGEVGYETFVSPGYPDLGATVLHGVDWTGDNGGDLVAVAEQAAHPLLVRPHALPANLQVNFEGWGDQDMVIPAADATLVMALDAAPDRAGLLAYDDNAAPQAGQIVYAALNLGAVDPTLAAQLTENALAYLLADEPPPTASISGTITMADGSTPSDVMVTLSTGASQVTGPDGRYEFLDLYGGLYTVTATRAGYAYTELVIDLPDGVQYTGADMMLLPVTIVSASLSPELPIPDGDEAGVVSLITVTETGTLADISVDVAITHPYVSDLRVRLFSPSGTIITLHDRSGGAAQDLVGNWPATLTVDGPGALEDLRGEEIAGVWVLQVSDLMLDDAGTLESWGVNLAIPASVTAVGELPAVTRLVGAAPNPFNPQTVIRSDLARAGDVRLDLYDLRGRLVRRLVRAELPAGRHDVRWDGRDDGGRGVSSGVYLARLVSGGVDQKSKLTLVR
jgi:subtilisin family serine protease/subtilisin-like proprotein convertase family protein